MYQHMPLNFEKKIGKVQKFFRKPSNSSDKNIEFLNTIRSKNESFGCMVHV